MKVKRSIYSRTLDAIRKVHFDTWIILLIGLVIALLLRLSLWTYYTRDYPLFTMCYTDIQKLGLAHFKTGCLIHPPLIEYIYYFETLVLPKMSNIGGTKLPLISFDFICAWIIYLIVRLKYKTDPIPYFAFFAFLFSPTIFLVSAGWGQFDILYTTFLVASLYFILKEKGWLACLMVGFAFSFKLQTVVFLPFLIILTFKKKISFWSLFLIPAVYLITVLPSWLAGRSLIDLLTIYTKLPDIFNELTITAPNVYYWIPQGNYSQFYLGSLAFAAGMIFLFCVGIYKSRTALTTKRLVLLAMISAIVVPYFLPKMHDRYFFPADILSFVFGFYFPEFFFIPIVVNLVSYFSFQGYFFEISTFSYPVLALVLLVVILILVKILIREFYPKEGIQSEGITKTEN